MKPAAFALHGKGKKSDNMGKSRTMNMPRSVPSPPVQLLAHVVWATAHLWGMSYRLN